MNELVNQLIGMIQLVKNQRFCEDCRSSINFDFIENKLSMLQNHARNIDGQFKAMEKTLREELKKHEEDCNNAVLKIQKKYDALALKLKKNK